jgi:hypothetical protein
MNWTQPICRACYAERHPDREPACFVDERPETCCDCGKQTTDGIYYRVDPRTVKHPTVDREDIL